MGLRALAFGALLLVGCDIDDLPNEEPELPTVEDVMSISTPFDVAGDAWNNVDWGPAPDDGPPSVVLGSPPDPPARTQARGQATLCQPCTLTVDCQHPGACVSYPTGETFCGAACSPFTGVDDCPKGFECAPMFIPEASLFLYQCRTILDSCTLGAP